MATIIIRIELHRQEDIHCTVPPGSMPGPQDSTFLFDRFIEMMKGTNKMPRNKEIKKVLVIGSGPIVIGQAAEFDYAVHRHVVL
mgnify:CR=1 FL=1